MPEKTNKDILDKAWLLLADSINISWFTADELREIANANPPGQNHSQGHVIRALQTLIAIEKSIGNDLYSPFMADDKQSDLVLNVYMLVSHIVSAFANKSELARERAILVHEKRYAPIKNKAIRLYKEREWHSYREAAMFIAPILLKERDCPLSEDRAVKTLSEWFSKYTNN